MISYGASLSLTNLSSSQALNARMSSLFLRTLNTSAVHKHRFRGNICPPRKETALAFYGLQRREQRRRRPSRPHSINRKFRES